MSDAKRQQGIPEANIREEIDRILRSPMFVQSERLGRFLRYAVEAALSDKADSLKEYVIGTEVYDRQPPYHPSNDSIVRTEARRLRAKLREYYESDGIADQVLIYFRPGSYAPVFRLRDGSSLPDPPADSSSSEDLFMDGRGISIAVVPFESNTEERVASACAIAITDELIHALMRTEGCRVTSASAVTPLEQHAAGLPALAKKLGVQVFFEGSVRQEGQRLRVTARIISADGFQLWSQRFDAEPEPDRIFAVSEQIALSLVSRTRPELSSIRQLKSSAGAAILNSYPAVLAAEALVDEGTASDIGLAILRFEEVLQMRPDYARPFCGVAQSYYELALRGAGVSAATVTAAKAKARQAAVLDPQMIQAHGCVAALSVLEWNFGVADDGFRQALILGAHAATYRQYALFLTIQKRFDDAWSYLQRAEQMDAFSHRQKIASARFFYISRRYSELDSAFPTRPVSGQPPLEARLYLALAFLKSGRIDEASEIAREARHNSGTQPAIAALLAEVLAYCGKTSEANELVRDLALLSPAPGISKFRQSLLAIALGDEPAALSFLSAAYENHEPELIWLHVDPRLDALRGHPRFAPLAPTLAAPVR